MFSSNTSQVSEDANYIESCFSTWLYTGNGSTQTINNGIDLAGKGGLVWLKSRSGADAHELTNTIQGISNSLRSNSTNGASSTDLTGFTSSGFTLGYVTGNTNVSGSTYASWTFRKAPKFFDVVTWTGDGNGAGQTINHNLGSVPGFIICKSTSATGDWAVCARTGAGTYATGLSLNSTAAALYSGSLGDAPTATTFSTAGIFDAASGGTYPNVNGVTYVAYLFAHNAGGFGLTGTDNVISCGSFATDGSAAATVNLGYEPQFVLFKRTDSSTNGDWVMFDNMRGLPATGSGSIAARLIANTSAAENPNTGDIKITSTGFVIDYVPSATFIYIAIRRGPMRTPTSGTSVFNPAFFGTNGVMGYLGAPADMNIQTHRNTSYSFNPVTRSRLVGGNRLTTSNTDAEVADATNFWSNMTGINPQGETQSLNSTVIDWTFRRAPGFFDEVCDTGTGASHTITHGLTVSPELLIRKQRSGVNNWCVYTSALGNTKVLNLESTGSPYTDANAWNSTSPTSSVFSVGTSGETNTSGGTFVTYLFASCPGVSKVFNFTGNGSSQTINCGFTGGARFVMIKRTDSTGDWYVWDSARGIVSGNDPRLSLNTTAAEVTTDDSVDTDSTGFVVNQLSATNVNVNGASYIGLAIA